MVSGEKRTTEEWRTSWSTSPPSRRRPPAAPPCASTAACFGASP